MTGYLRNPTSNNIPILLVSDLNIKKFVNNYGFVYSIRLVSKVSNFLSK